MDIRKATSEDAISNLITKLATKLIALTVSQNGLEKPIDSITADSILTYFEIGYRYHVGVINNEFIGVVGVKDRSHFYHLFVKEEFQGNGYASNLWNTAKQA